MRWLIALGILWSAAAPAFDSRCRATDPDCSGEEAARTPWMVSEHGALWLEARQLAGLPEALDEPFVVRTPVLAGQSLAAAPLDLATSFVERRIELAVFAQLPDLSYTLWDWTSGNEGCPPSGTAGFAECHAFRAHMGWLNSTHFLPQAEQVFTYLHALAVQRAEACSGMRTSLGEGSESVEVLRACDREALLIEAQAHHYLQDAWSMGHMWQRWGSPELSDFAGAAAIGLASVKGVGDAVGRGSGIIHGAKALTGFDDAMCGPQPGVAFVHDGAAYAGAGDLFTTALRTSPPLAGQRDLMRACLVSAMREVYVAGAHSFGPAVEPGIPTVSLSTCFSQRATNRAIALGAAIQLPGELQVLPPPLGAILSIAHSEYLTSLDVDPNEPTSLFLPLTSELLTRLNGVVKVIEGEPLFAPDVLSRWHEDMGRIQTTLSIRSARAPSDTDVADGRLGPLLNLQPNAAYEGVPAYADPPLPWRPELTSVPLTPTIENAGNILARTFFAAHADDWCAVLHPAGDDEFSIAHLRDRCITASANEEAVACGICADAARLFVVDPDGLTDAPVCDRLGSPDQRIEFRADVGESTAALAARYCETGSLVLEGLAAESVEGCERSRDVTVIQVRAVDGERQPLRGVRVEFFLDDLSLGVFTSNSDGIAEVTYDTDDSAVRRVVAKADGVEVSGKFPIANLGENCSACAGTTPTQADIDACSAASCRLDDDACFADLTCLCAFACDGVYGCGCADAENCGCCCGCS